MNRLTKLSVGVGGLLVAFGLGATMAATGPASDPAGADGPYSIFAGTMADMTWPDVEAEAKSGAVALWGLAVIEEHGPALPLATDTYQVTSTARQVKADLAGQGIKSVIVPTYYFGVNEATGSFPGSIDVRPAIMTEVMVDTFKSLKTSGFKRVFCLPGHGDGKHNKAIYDAVARAASEAGIEAFMITNAPLVARIGLDPKDPRILLTGGGPGAAGSGPPVQFVEGHSGAGEHSTMSGLYPKVVKLDVIPTLKNSQVTPEKLTEWRKGYEIARKITPLGYVGDPSAADAARGRAQSAAGAKGIADVIAAKMKAG